MIVMADVPSPAIAGLEMLLERISALESHARVATVFRQRDAEAMPAGTELTSDMYDCGTFIRVKKCYDGCLNTACDLVVLDWEGAMSKCIPDLLAWAKGTSEIDESDRAAERALGAGETARLRAACLVLLQAMEERDGNTDNDHEIKTAELGIAQGPFVPVAFIDWWLSVGLKALVPEVVAATWGSAVLNLSRRSGVVQSRPLTRVFEIVQLLSSSARFEVDPTHVIDMSIAPWWQAGLLRAETANGSDAMEAELKAELASNKTTRSRVDEMLRRADKARWQDRQAEAEEEQKGLWMSDDDMSRLCTKIGYRL